MRSQNTMLKQLLIKHEGVRLKPYQDTVGKWTIGVGRNLDDVGITYEEAMYLLTNDLRHVENDCLHAFPWYADLDEARQAVVASMVFNLGLAGFLRFKKLIKAIEQEDWPKAATEMLASQWAVQVGQRADELSTMMLRGSITK